MSAFRYHPDVLARFPTIRAGVVSVAGASNGPSPGALVQQFLAEQAAARDALSDVALADLPSIAAWRRVFSGFGVSPTKYRNAAEALLRRVQKKGDVPSVSLLVDLGNLVSIRHRVPVAVIDADRIAGGITVAISDGTEHFADLGGTEAEQPEPGEVVFLDHAGEVAARRWCWRQSTVSGVSNTTTNVLIAVEAHHDGGEAEVAAAIRTFRTFFAQHLPDAVVTFALLDPSNPTFDA